MIETRAVSGRWRFSFQRAFKRFRRGKMMIMPDRVMAIIIIARSGRQKRRSIVLSVAFGEISHALFSLEV